MEKEEPLQNKYVFCTSILSNMLEQEMKNISDCCIKLKDLIDNIRALNLSNCVALVLFEALRQQDYPNLLRSEPFKGEDYLLDD